MNDVCALLVGEPGCYLESRVDYVEKAFECLFVEVVVLRNVVTRVYPVVELFLQFLL
mgnify:CR=1 FL=1